MLFEKSAETPLRLASYPNFADYRAQGSPFARLAFVLGQTMVLKGASFEYPASPPTHGYIGSVGPC